MLVQRTGKFWVSVSVFLPALLAPGLLCAEPIEDIKAGIVKITAEVNGKPRVGTGIIVRLEKEAAYIVTASHVVEGDQEPQVAFYPDPNEPFTAKVLGSETGEEKGLAALRVKGTLPSELRALQLDTETTVRGGEDIEIIGFPGLGLVPWAVTKGSIMGRQGPDLVFAAGVNEGNSGGPLLVNERVVGVVTSVLGQFRYATPSSIVQTALIGWGVRIDDQGGEMSARSSISQTPKADESSDEMARLREELEAVKKESQAKATKSERLQAELEATKKQGQAKAEESLRLHSELEALKSQLTESKTGRTRPIPQETREPTYSGTKKLLPKSETPAEGYEIHLQSPHLMVGGGIGGPFHHYCKGISAEVLQCLLFESTDPKAKLVAVEYFISKELTRKEVQLIKWNRNFHDHKIEIETGRVQVLDMHPDEAKAVAEAAAKTDGIIFHFWHNDQKVPDGRVTIPTSLGHVFRFDFESSGYKKPDFIALQTRLTGYRETKHTPATGFSIHILAPHLMVGGRVGGPFHHYCKGISDEVLQCLLFESTDPKAKLVAIEYFVAKSLARKEVPLIKWNRNFHDHKVEIATGRVKVLDMPEDKAKKVAELASMTDGVIFHFWHSDQNIPDGRVTIPTSVGHVFRTQ